MFWQGSVLYNYFTNGKLERTDGGSIAEGIGQGRVTKNMEGVDVDQAFAIQDTDAVTMVSKSWEIVKEPGMMKS